MDLSIIIVSWNVKEKLRECLRSIEDTMDHNSPQLPLNLRGEELEYEVFVVDNASKDGSMEMVKKEFPAVYIIANDFNAGFAKANNQAIRLSQGRFVLLLNPDMRLFPGTLEGMVKFMDEPRNDKVGVAGCHLVSPKSNVIASEAGSRAQGRSASGGQSHGQDEEIATPHSSGARDDGNYSTVPHVRRFPALKDQLAIMLKIPHLFPRVTDAYMTTNFDYGKEARVDSIRGSFFMIRRELMDKIGLLDEGFFIWFEEVDFCKRTIEAGYEVAYTPVARAVDYVGQSFRQIKFYPKQKMFTRSMVYYFKKHAPWWQYRILWILRPLTLGAVWLGDKIRALHVK